MAEERLFTIPLKNEFLKAPIYKRSSKAVRAVKDFILRNMKSDEVSIGKELNLLLWSKGRTNPPSKVKVKSILRDKIALVNLIDAKFEEPVKKEEDKKSIAEKLLSKKDSKAEEDKEKQKELKKELEKEEELEQKKEHIHEVMEKPSKSLKQNEKILEKTEKYSKVIPETGKKDAKEPKP